MREQDKIYCVYCHTNKHKGKRYVGITCKSPSQRWQGGNRYDHNSHFRAAILKYGWDGFDRNILHSGLTHDEACEYERRYISDWGLRNENLGYNLTDGGEGCLGRKLSVETRRKISESHMGISAGRVLSAETKAKISAALTGKKHPYTRPTGVIKFSEEDKHRLSEIHKMPMDMYSKSDEYIMSFGCAKDAAEYVGLKTSQDISKCCNGVRKSVGGYRWRYRNDA